MKLKLKKLFAMFLVVTLVMPMSLMSVSAAGEPEPLPESLTAPSVIVYDNGSRNTEIEVKIKAPDSVLDFYEKAFTNASMDSGYNYSSDYGQWSGISSAVQIDYKIDDGEWQHKSNWDTSIYNADIVTGFSGHYATKASVAWFSSYSNYGLAKELIDAGYVKTTTDGSTTYYRFDAEHHRISVRARFFVQVVDHDYNYKVILSPWSETATYGTGNGTTSDAPTSLSAPVLSNLTINSKAGTYSGAPKAKFKVTAKEDVIEAMNWSEQYDGTLESSEINLVVETSLDPDFGEGVAIDKRTIYETTSFRWTQEYDELFYDLWYEINGQQGGAFSWNGETVYMRAKYVNERYIDNDWSSIESPYSNVVSLAGPVIQKFDVNITHETYGFDAEGYFTESYSITEGRDLWSVYCDPLEGCYVDKVTVNDKVMYDKSDESTYELLHWWSSYTAFEFLSGEDKATEDLNIVISYAGTPTEKYGITTEWGNGGTLYVDSYDSWEDNSLVVFHSSTPTITIRPYGGFEIDKVKVNGVENAQAKETGEYTFPPVTNNDQSIEVTFKRVAYSVDSYAYHGIITTDYAGYQDSQYVKIGDDITFRFEPKQASDGNYYEIEQVYVDNVLNEEAKQAGSYTFRNVQAAHSISVYYSDEPVITYDITATSGDHGSISPEGVIHAREGSTQRFEFIPDSGYEVDQVTVDGVEITNLASKEYYNIANIQGEHTIHVTFKKMPVQYDINVIVSGDNPSVHTVNPRGVTPVWEGEGFALAYHAFAGYEVEKLLIDGTQAPVTGTYEILAVNADHTIEIFFKVKSYSVTFVDYDGTVLKTERVDHGSKAKPPADPTRKHYVFDGWDTQYSEITTNVTVKATYRPADYTVKFVGWDGKVLKTETVSYTKDATAPTPPEREGYYFSHWSADYTNVSRDLRVTAVYVQKEYTVNFVDADDTLISTQKVKHGEAAVLPDNPTKEGYAFIGWDQTGYGYVTQDMTFKAMYREGEAQVFTITAVAHGISGTITPIGETSIIEAGSLTFYFYPDAFAEIAKVEVDGEEVALCESYAFEFVSADHTIDVYFQPTAEIHVKDDSIENGSVHGHYDLIDDQMVYILDVTPDEGYELEGIYINGERVELEIIDGKYILRDFSEDMDIDVRFSKIDAGENEIGNGESSDNNAGKEENSIVDGDKEEVSDEESDRDDRDLADEITEDDESPATGDNQQIGLWGALLLGAIAIFLLIRKKSSKTVD